MACAILGPPLFWWDPKEWLLLSKHLYLSVELCPGSELLV